VCAVSWRLHYFLFLARSRRRACGRVQREADQQAFGAADPVALHQALANCESQRVNQPLIKLDYMESWAFGGRVLACGPAGSLAWTMAFDPEEFVTLTDHGSMKLRAAVLRAMTLLPKERKRTTIVREGEPAILNFKEIKNLAAQWDEWLVPND
jgi:hypothetical protein